VSRESMRQLTMTGGQGKFPREIFPKLSLKPE
jgi:hypothetical protein